MACFYCLREACDGGSGCTVMYHCPDCDGAPGAGWQFFTRRDYERFLTALVETDGEGSIAGYRVDEDPERRPGMVRVQIRHRLRNLLRPTRRAGIAFVLQEAIDHGRPPGVHVEVVASYCPLWLRGRP